MYDMLFAWCVVCLLVDQTLGRSRRRRRSAKIYSHLVELLQDISTDLLQLLQAGHRVLRLLVNGLQLGSHLSKDCSLLKELSLSHSGIQLGEVATEDSLLFQHVTNLEIGIVEIVSDIRYNLSVYLVCLFDSGCVAFTMELFHLTHLLFERLLFCLKAIRR